MSSPSLVCLSLTPNLRCVGFTPGQLEALIIPPVIEVVISLLFIYLYSGPGRQVFESFWGSQSFHLVRQAGANSPCSGRHFVFRMVTAGHVVARGPRSADFFACF